MAGTKMKSAIGATKPLARNTRDLDLGYSQLCWFRACTIPSTHYILFQLPLPLSNIRRRHPQQHPPLHPQLPVLLHLRRNRHHLPALTRFAPLSLIQTLITVRSIMVGFCSPGARLLCFLPLSLHTTSNILCQIKLDARGHHHVLGMKPK